MAERRDWYYFATVVAAVEVDDGQGGTIAVTKRVETTVPSTPRPADACQVRAYPQDAPEIAGYGPWDSTQETEQWQEVGAVYLTDACGNILHDLGKNDSPDHDKPGDEFHITGVTPDQGGEVYATAEMDQFQWLYHLKLHGTHDFGNNRVGIPEGIYQINLEIASTADCGDGAHIADAYTADYANGRPVMELQWDLGRGAEPTDLTASPEAALRDPATGDVAAWRALPIDAGQVPEENHGATYTDVPVKLYVASVTKTFDQDGNLVEDYQQIPGVELCTGEVHQLIDAGHPWPGQITTTCDQTHPDEFTTTVSSDPAGAWVWGGGTYDGPLGPSVGITKAPSEPGDYYLVAEPLDETFRRGQSWKVDHGIGWPKPVVRFTVMGGVFLDENYMPVDSVEVPGNRTIHIRTTMPEQGQDANADLTVLSAGVQMYGANVILHQESSLGNGLATYIGTVKLIDTGAAGSNTPGLSAERQSSPDSTINVTPPLDGTLELLGQQGILLALARLWLFSITIDDVRGLYKPIDGRYDINGGSYVPGYKSDDNEGRVYANWAFDPANPGLGHYQPPGDESQYVEVAVTLDPTPPDDPTRVGVRWEIIDPDDHSNEGLAAGSACTIDPNDCNPERTIYEEARPDDNSGRFGETWWTQVHLPNGGLDPEFPIVDSYTDQGKQYAVTPIRHGSSKVRFVAPRVGGDNLIIIARVVDLAHPESNLGRSNRTGEVTVWKKIYVENRWMDDGSELPVDQLQTFFERTFIEFVNEPSLPDTEGQATPWDYLEPNPPWPGLSEYVGKWTDSTSVGQFHHRGDGGWHFACATRSLSEDEDGVPPPPPDPLYSGTLTVEGPTLLRASQPIFPVKNGVGQLPGFGIIINPGESNEFTFTISDNTQDTIRIMAFDQYWTPDSQPKVPQGINLAYPHLNYGSTVDYEVYESTSVTVGATPEGRAGTVIFSSTIANVAPPEEVPGNTLRTLLHEMMHTFHLYSSGLDIDHNCGNPSINEMFSCVGNWPNLPVWTYDGQFVHLPSGSLFCAEHIRALRRASAEGGN